MNTRDEPHADPERYRRLHVINGDANLCEVATFLKVGTMLLVLDLIEDEALPEPPALADPVAGVPRGQPRPDPARPLRLDDGRHGHPARDPVALPRGARNATSRSRVGPRPWARRSSTAGRRC